MTARPRPPTPAARRRHRRRRPASCHASSRRRPTTRQPTAADGVGADAGGAETSEEDEPTRSALPPESPYDRPGQWFVIHSYAGYENKVKSNLESRIASMNMEERIFEVVIPMEDVIEFKNGKKQVVSKKVFPGYLLVRIELDDDSWYVVRNTPGVTGFVGLGARPTPLSRRRSRTSSRSRPRTATGPPTKKSRPRLEYELGESVRVREGPVRRLQRHHRRDQRGPAQAQGPRQHFRTGNPRRAGLRPSGEAVRGAPSPMAKRRVTAIVKIQLPAGKATPAPSRRHGPRAPRRADDGVRQAVQRRHRGQGRPGHPGRDHHLRGPVVHLRPEDPADGGAAPPGGRAGKRGPDHRP